MGYSLKFIHTADIHLGSILNLDNIEQVKDSVYDAFSKIIAYAVDKRVNFILISGDLYDRENKSLKGNKFFTDQCRKLLEHNINVYVIGGNHDPLQHKSEIFEVPANVFIASSEKCSEFEVVDDRGNVIARIYGESYRGKAEGRQLYNDYNPIDNNVFNIGMLHTDLNSKNFNYAPCSMEALKEKININYWALGHIHKFNILYKEKPVIAYSGIPQGRDIGEEGIGGCLFVEVDEFKNSRLTFLPTASVRWEKVELNINKNVENSPKNLTELIKLIEERAKEFINEMSDPGEKVDFSEDLVKGYSIRWIVKGQGDIKQALEESEENVEEFIRDELNEILTNYTPFIYTEAVDLRIEKPLLNLKDLKENNSTFEEIYKIISEYHNNPASREDLINSFGQVWEKDYDNENINFSKLQLDEDTFSTILKKAEDMILEGFLRGGN